MIGNSPWHWWVAAVTLIPLVIWLLYRGLWQDRSRQRPRCPRCWYAMTGLEGKPCPECGHVVTNPRHYFRTRRRWGNVLLVILILALAYDAPLVTRRITKQGEKWWQALEPTTSILLRQPVVKVPPPAASLPARQREELLLTWPTHQVQRRLAAEQEQLYFWQTALFVHALRWQLPQPRAWLDTVDVMTFLAKQSYRHRAAVRALADLADHDEPRVRAASMRHLWGTCGDARAADAVAKCLGDDSAVVVRMAMGHVNLFVQLGDAHSSADLLQVLQALLKCPHGTGPMRITAGRPLVAALCKRGPPDVADRFLQMVTDAARQRPLHDFAIEVLGIARQLRGEPPPLRVEIKAVTSVRHSSKPIVSLHLIPQDVDQLPLALDSLLDPGLAVWRVRLSAANQADDVSYATYLRPPTPPLQSLTHGGIYAQMLLLHATPANLSRFAPPSVACQLDCYFISSKSDREDVPPWTLVAPPFPLSLEPASP